MKIGKEIKINNSSDYNLAFGSMNKNNPDSVYLNISSWIEPQTEYSNRTVKNLRKNIKQDLFNLLDQELFMFDKNKSIVDLDIRESGIKLGKKSFMNCEITLFLRESIPLSDEILQLEMQSLSSLIIDKNLIQNKAFKLNKKKK